MRPVQQVSTFLPLILVVFASSLSPANLNAQGWLKDMYKDDSKSISDKNIFDIQNRAKEYFKFQEQEYYSRHFELDDYPELEYKNVRDFISYKRWEEYWMNHVNIDGEPVPALTEYNEFLKFKNRQSKGPIANWTNINRTEGKGGYWGMGRIREIAFHPTDPNTFWLGADQGGIWKSEDNGNTYTAIGDELPFLRVSSLCVDYTNPDIIYMAGGGIGTNYWQRAIGVYKTIDGGLNWEPSGFTSELWDNKYIRRLAISPTDPRVLIVTTKDGTYRTADSGTTWTWVNEGESWDILFHPDGNTIFIGKGSKILRSLDSGITWATVVNSAEAGIFKHFTFSPLNTDKLAAQQEGSGFTSIYVSIDKGVTWLKKSRVTEDTGGTIGFSSMDENTLYRGWTKIFKSENLGESWDQKTNWYSSQNYPEVHADHFRIEMNPHKADTLYFCNDGGLYIYDEALNNWSEKSEGLIISQYYSLSSSQSDPDVLLCGSQDNGGWYRKANGSWTTTNGGDGMHTWQDPNNIYYGYSSYPGGKLYRTVNAWNNYSSLYDNFIPKPTDGDWNSRFAIDPNNTNRIVTGCFKDVYESLDRGETWSLISNSLTAGYNLHTITIPEADSEIIYTSSGAYLYYTYDGGESWNNSYVGQGNTIQEIAVSDYDPKLLWVVTSGYREGSKVFRSDNGGKNFQNISGSLPNIPGLSIIHRKGSTEDIYVGMTYGIYYRSKNMDDWDFYGHGIPNTEIRDLDIQYAQSKIRCATYGRGLYEADLHTPIGARPVADYSTDKASVCALENIQFSNNSSEALTYLWNFGDGTNSTLENPQHNYKREGSYTVRLTAINENNTSTFSGETVITVKPNLEPVSLGPAERNIGGGTFSGGEESGLIFNVNSPSKILSVKVYSIKDIYRTFRVFDNMGNLINSVFARVKPGENRVILNTEVPPGKDYILDVSDSEGLFFDYSGASFPYSKDDQVSITGNTDYTRDHFYYFYDWEVEYLACDISSLTELEEGYNILAERIISYPNPVTDKLNIRVNGFELDEDISLKIIKMDGTTVFKMDLETVREIEIDISSFGNSFGSHLIEIRGDTDIAVKQILRIIK